MLQPSAGAARLLELIVNFAGIRVAVFGDGNLVALPLEQKRERFAERRLVFNNENTVGHGRQVWLSQSDLDQLKRWQPIPVAMALPDKQDVIEA